MGSNQYHTALSDLFKCSEQYHAALTAHAPFYSGMTVYGMAALYECHIHGEEAPIMLVIDGIAYETDCHEICDLRY
jgi:hypothetical protein